MKNPLIVYHGPSCLDGMAAAWCMYRLFGDNAEYIVGRYQSNDEIDFADRDIYLVDFSYPRDMLVEKILPVANKVFLIDHHKSALKDLEGFEAPNFNMHYCSDSKSGAMLAWEFVVDSWLDMGAHAPETPELLKIIQDRDLWKFQYTNTKAVTTALFARDLNYKLLGNYMGDVQALELLRREGQILLDAHDKECANLIKYASRVLPVKLSDDITLEVITVNAPPKYSSDVGNILAREHRFAMTYWDSANHREFSLRSAAENPEHTDVSLIAKMFGGGGHKHAAGFKVPRNHYLAQV